MTLLHYFFDLTSFYRLGQKYKNRGVSEGGAIAPATLFRRLEGAGGGAAPRRAALLLVLLLAPPPTFRKGGGAGGAINFSGCLAKKI